MTADLSPKQEEFLTALFDHVLENEASPEVRYLYYMYYYMAVKRNEFNEFDGEVPEAIVDYDMLTTRVLPVDELEEDSNILASQQGLYLVRVPLNLHEVFND